MRGQAHHWPAFEENIRTANDRDGDGVVDDESRPRGNELKTLLSSRHHSERRTSHIGEGYEVLSSMFTACFAVVCDGRLWRFFTDYDASSSPFNPH